MMGQESSQKSFHDADHICTEVVPEDLFYHTLFLLGPALFEDEDFAAMYCDDNGCRSLPPSLMAKVLLLQEYENISDRKAVENARYNIAWKHALEDMEVTCPAGAGLPIKHTTAEITKAER